MKVKLHFTISGTEDTAIFEGETSENISAAIKEFLQIRGIRYYEADCWTEVVEGKPTTQPNDERGKMLTDEVKKNIKIALEHLDRFAPTDEEGKFDFDIEMASVEHKLNKRFTEMVEGEKKEAYKEGALGAYKMFLETIKDAKNKFPNSKEFEIVVDVRDIEKSIEYLSKGSKVKE